MSILEKIRLDKGLNRPELSAASDVPVSTLHKLEIGASDIKGAKADTLYKLAHALGTSMEHLLGGYLSTEFIDEFNQLDSQCIILLKNEIEQLKWEYTGITQYTSFRDKYIASLSDAAKILGYRPLAKLNTMEYCYEKNGEIIILKGPGNILMAKLPKTLNDIRPNDGICCNGEFTMIESYDELPR